MKRRQPNSNQKRIQRIYEVALAGITTALVFLLLAISMIVKYGSIGFFFFAALALVLPLYKKYYFATIFAYIAASLLCLAMPYDIMSAMGFIFYFGPISIASIIMYEKKVKWFISYPIKVIYMAGSIAFLYFVAGNIMFDFNVINSIPFWAIELIGIVVLLAMDIAQTFIYRWFAPIVGKVIRDKKVAKNTEEMSPENETNEDTVNPFDGEDKEEYFMVDFKEKLKDVPSKPGVYMMLDDTSSVIYVGKAKILVNRLRQYFNNSSKPEKVMAMLEHVADFRYIICQSEEDALVTENNLIKEYKPHYNILLKDDKNYPYIRVGIKEEYPSVTYTRKLVNDGAKYFGPYMVSVNIKDIFELIHTAFKIRDCRRDLDKPSRPCLNYHLGRCLAPCKGDVSVDEYRAEIDKVIAFLKGDDKEIEKKLRERMEYFSKQENFEVALTYRDKLKTLEKLIRKQVSAIPKDYNLDIFAVASNGLLTAVNLMVVRGGKFVGSDNFITDGIVESKSQYIYAFYEKNKPICDEIVVSDIEDKESLSKSISKLAGRKVNISIPEKGLRKKLLDLALQNAKDALDKYGAAEDRKKLRTIGAIHQLQGVLDLKNTPNRIECYDISHISGVDKVASMVVFEYGEPKKTHYRKFRIKDVEGNNDFACMKEVLQRRFTRMLDPSETDESFKRAPDLILLDGGAIQLKFAIDAMNECGANVEMIGLTKKDEEIILPYEDNPIFLPLDSLALQLLQRLRDESHRFAITFHRSLHSKSVSMSTFTEIDGVGDKTAKKLYQEFGSLENVKNSTIDDLVKAGVGKGLAIKILEYLKNL